MKEILTLTSGVNPSPFGQVVLTGIVGTNLQWIVPSDVRVISVVCVGVGSKIMSSSGEGGGGLSYRNLVPVTPGEILLYDIVGIGSTLKHNTVLKRQDGTIICQANSGLTRLGGKAANEINDGGGNGGAGNYSSGGGGGAGGYSGNGGNGGYQGGSGSTPGQGGGGGGGWGSSNPLIGGAGGGVGLLGEGPSGGTGTSDTTAGRSGRPGSGGSGITYGGGGNRYSSGGGNTTGGAGAIRIIWGPIDRYFPTTNTQDM